MRCVTDTSLGQRDGNVGTHPGVVVDQRNVCFERGTAGDLVHSRENEGGDCAAYGEWRR
jgi:hypothetical protein